MSWARFGDPAARLWVHEIGHVVCGAMSRTSQSAVVFPIDGGEGAECRFIGEGNPDPRDVAPATALEVIGGPVFSLVGDDRFSALDLSDLMSNPATVLAIVAAAEIGTYDLDDWKALPAEESVNGVLVTRTAMLVAIWLVSTGAIGKLIEAIGEKDSAAFDLVRMRAMLEGGRMLYQLAALPVFGDPESVKSMIETARDIDRPDLASALHPIRTSAK